MKKLLGLVAFVLASAPLAYAQAQDNPDLRGHPDARNDRQMQSHEREAHHRVVAIHAHHVKHDVDHRRPRPVDHKM
ncbi:hypothetical protein [Polaromonas sp. C04]|uniref:hypothetical protein n=1 Tax=Polaromonas sp. C04 TaxID=1945857 RepID=UPI000985A229|nr:hypothetical protein [Polaromonas sp. C04]OOG58684.1 hypothetical protein B0E49_01870 [Polaromonas sp. C04]